MLASGRSIEPELKAARIETKKTGPFSLGQGYIPQVGQAEEILDAVFKLSKQKPLGPKLYASGNDYYFIKLESVEFPKAKDAALNRESAASSLTTQLQSTFLNKWIENLKDKSTVRVDAKFEPSTL